MNYKDFEIKIAPRTDTIIFYSEKSWVFKLTPEGIKFNREIYPNAHPDEFANEVIRILEKCYKIEFKKRSQGI